MENLWDIEEDTFSAFCGEESAKTAEELLLGKLGLSSMQDNQRAMIVFEFIFNILEFCSKSSFDYSKFQVILKIFQKCFDQFILADAGSPEEAIELFKVDMRACGQFDVDSSRNVATFFSTSFIRNFSGYRYVMTNLPVEKTDLRILSVQTPLILPPCDSQAMSSSSSIATMQ